MKSNPIKDQADLQLDAAAVVFERSKNPQPNLLPLVKELAEQLGIWVSRAKRKKGTYEVSERLIRRAKIVVKELEARG